MPALCCFPPSDRLTDDVTLIVAVVLLWWLVRCFRFGGGGVVQDSNTAHLTEKKVWGRHMDGNWFSSIGAFLMMATPPWIAGVFIVSVLSYGGSLQATLSDIYRFFTAEKIDFSTRTYLHLLRRCITPALPYSIG